MLRRLIVLALAAAALTSCGTPGAPQAPSLRLPRPPEDVTAVRKGNKVYLSWTMPRETTEGVTLKPKWVGATRVCRGLSFPITDCAQLGSAGSMPASAVVVGELAPAQTPIPQQEKNAPKLTFTDTLTPEIERGHATDFATYAIAVPNSRGKLAGLSNQVKVPLAPVKDAPSRVEAQLRSDSILLTWPARTHLDHLADYRVTRRDDAPGAIAVVDCRTSAFFTDSGLADCADHSFQWEHTYYYKVTPITRVMKNGQVNAEVEGEDSPEVKVFAHDTFPPAQPTGVQAVFSGVGQKPFIDVTWAPNTDEDLAGYNVYRHEQGTEPQKLNAKLLATPSFRDDAVQPGHTYIYAVSAVDLRNNESPRSEESSETVPK